MRVGNLVECTHPSGVKEVTEVMVINAMSGLITHEHKGVGYDDYVGSLRPIELNEEWLKRMGFEYYKTEKSHVYRLGSFLVTYVFDGKFKGKKYLKFCDTTYPEFGHIQYVHTFQNFFFASVGHELEIK